MPAEEAAARPKYATPAELADYLRMDTGTLANWRSRGKGPRYKKMGGRNGEIRYPWVAIEEWEAAQPDFPAGSVSAA